MGFLMKRVGLASASFIFSFVMVTYGSRCDQPTSPHGSVIVHPSKREKYQNGQVILFGCKKGFYLDGMPIITCNGNKWTQTQFRCLGFCPEVRNILNGKVSHVTPQVGEAAIEFRCVNNSFQLIGKTRLECLDGRWNGKLPYCQKLPSCVRLQSPANGTLQGNDNSHSAEAKFTCYTGFDLFGTSTLTCNKGVWSSRVPTCKAYCTKIRNLPDGHVFGTRFSHGQVVSFNCKHGYELVGDRSLRCINGILRWNSSVPQCKASCKDPGNPSNGRKVDHDFRHKKTVSFTCQKNYALEGARTVTCLNGQWSAKRPLCLALCPMPIAPTNGRIQGKDFRHGQSIKFWCSRGFTRVGASSATCNKGKWDRPFSVCKGKCKFEGSPKNGYTTNGIFPNGKLLSHGSNIEYACDAWYTMDGTNILYCNDGFWNASIPSCKATCTDPGLIDRGKRNGTHFSHGQVVTYECSTKNYSLVGNPRLTCNDGVWDSAPPVCKKSCNLLPLLSNGKIHNNGVSHGAVVSFSCNSGFQPLGSLQIKCLDGIWNESSPSCIGVCAKPGKLGNGTVVGSNYSYGSVIKFKCNKGYKLRGSAKLKCRRGVWEGQFPECEVCVRVGAVFWAFWRNNKKADNYWKASITRITATHFDFALVNNNKLTRSYRRTDQKLIVDKVPSIGDLLPSSPVIAHQFGHSGWYRTGKVNDTSGDSLVKVQFDDGGKKWVKLGRVRLVSYPDFCSNVE